MKIQTQRSKSRESSDPYYDIESDWSLIVASFQSDYGLRLGQVLQEGMSWGEFSALINGLSGDSPLGRLVAIRAENDPQRLKEFTPEQRKLRNDYRRMQAQKMSTGKVEEALDQFEVAFLRMAGKADEKA